MVLLALFSLICCAFNQKKQLITITHKDTLRFLIGKGLSQTDYPIWIFLSTDSLSLRYGHLGFLVHFLSFSGTTL